LFNKYKFNTNKFQSRDIRELIGWRIKINGVFNKDFQLIKVLDTIAGSKKFDAIFGESEKDQIFNHYDDIVIYGESSDIIFRGRIEEITPDHTNDTTIISGRDYVAELMDKYVVEHYDTKLRSYIIDDLLEKHSTHITRSNIGSSPSGSEYTHTFKSSVWDVLVGCAADDEYKFWVDLDNDFHYTPKGYTDSGMTLILGTDDIFTFNIEEASKDIINKVIIIGNRLSRITTIREDFDSQSHYGIIKSKQIFDDQIDTIELATIKADSYLAENAWVLDVIIFEVDGYETLNAGELITVTLSGHNIDGTYLVIDKQHEFPSGITTIRVARYEKNLETIINGLVDRLNNLEQQENIITTRIQKNYGEIKITETSTAIYSIDVNDTFLLGIGGHCELGSAKLGDRKSAPVLL
jgi:DNA/RNA endonuclease YhcR with UshA esterase domain